MKKFSEILSESVNARSFRTDYPNMVIFNSKSLGIKDVPVDKIVGLSRNEEFDSNFKPKNPNNLKFLNALELFKNNNNNLDSTIKTSPIVLIFVDGKYYVDSDGNHRVAAAKALKIEKIKALVHKVIKLKKY